MDVSKQRAQMVAETIYETCLMFKNRVFTGFDIDKATALIEQFEQQSRALPVYVSVPDVPRITDEGILLQPKKYEGPERRKYQRGDVARGLVDAALAGADVQEID